MERKNCKVSDEDVIAIRNIYMNLEDFNQTEIAKLYGVSQSHISRILADIRRSPKKRRVVE